MGNSGVTYNLPGTVSGVFFSKKDADGAYNALIKRGHTADDISVLMSDETLSNHESTPTTEEPVTGNAESVMDKTKDVIASAIISITSMISLPGLGIAISNTLFKKITFTDAGESGEKDTSSIIGSRIPKEHTGSYHDSMREGGIIISVDPRNKEEKKAIVGDFKNNNGHDILGDDGYTELD